MMKKRNEEGFALAYVVVVIFILCSIAIVLMSSTLRTLQAQENMVQRMKDKYAAMGEIERLVAELEADFANINYQITADGYEDSETCFNDALLAFNSFLANYGTDTDNSNAFIFDITQGDNSIQVSAQVSVTPDITISDYTTTEKSLVKGQNPLEPDEESWVEQEVTRWKYTVSISSPIFASYEITSVEGGESDA